MADDKIQVEVVGKTDGLSSSMNQAGNSVQSAMDRIRGAFNNVRSEGLNFESVISGIAGGALGGLLVEGAHMAMEAIEKLGEAFAKTVEAAEKFGIENGRLAAQLGTTVKDAASLNQSLSVLGKTGDDYANVVMRMTQRLKTQEDAWHSYGMATRDANGNLLQGRQLMQSAINTMLQYKAGIDQNSFALEVFGRSAKEVYDYMRLTDAGMEEASRDMEYFGINTEKAQAISTQFADSQDHLGNIVEDFQVMVGQRLLPTLTSWSEELAGPLRTGLLIIGNILLALVSIIEAVAGAFAQLMDVAGGAINAMATAVKGMYDATAQAASGDFAGAWESFRSIGTKEVGIVSSTITKMGTDAKGTIDNIKALWGDLSGSTIGAKGFTTPPGGSKSFVPADKGGSKPDKAAMDQAVADWKKMEGQKTEATQQQSLARLQIEKQRNDSDLALGKINVQQHAAKEKEIADSEYSIRKAALEKEAQLNSKEPLQHQKTLDEMKLLDIKHEQEIAQIQNKALEQQKRIDDQAAAHFKQAQDKKVAAAKAADKEILKDEKKTEEQSAQLWKSFSSSITSSFGNAIKGMIHGTMTWKEALGSIIDSVVDSFIDMGIQMLQNWIQTSIEKLFITKTTEAAAATSTITGAAAQAGANAYASTAAIPITGPALAPAAGAAAYAAALSYEGLAFAEKGMVVDKDRLVFAHKDEQILPAHIAKGMTSIIQNGGNQRGGDNHLTYAPTINAPQHKSLSRLLDEESRQMLGWLHAQKRNGNLKFA